MPGIPLASARPPFLLTIDVGTSSMRALVYDSACKLIDSNHFSSRTQVSLQTDLSGAAWFDPELLFASLTSVIDACVNNLGSKAKEVVGVAFDTFASSLVGLDEKFTPLTPVFTYADTRCSPQARALRMLHKDGASHQRTGCMIHSSYHPALLSWRKETNLEGFKKVRHWWSFGSLITQRLLGNPAVSLSLASWTGLLHRQLLEWDREWLSELGIYDEQLAPLADFSPALRTLQPMWEERWPALANAGWFLPISDGAAANIGSGCFHDSAVALTIGTTAAMRMVPAVIPHAVPLGLWNYRVDGKRPLLGGALTEGGNVHEWLNRILQLPPREECEKHLLSAGPGQHGLSFLPFLSGERAPGWRDDATAAVAGLRLGTSSLDLLQAGLEAVAFRLALIYKRLEPLVRPGRQILASGGFLQSPAWVKIIANVLGKEITPCLEPEATSRGLAWLALEALGLLDPSNPPPVETGPGVTPDMESHKQYQEALAAQEGLYRKLLG